MDRLSPITTILMRLILTGFFEHEGEMIYLPDENVHCLEVFPLVG